MLKWKILDDSTADLRYQKKESENLKMDQQISYLKSRKKTDERKVNSLSDPGDNVKPYNTCVIKF